MFSWWDIGDWNTELTLFSSLEIMPRKYSAVKYVQRCFGKDKMSWWDSIQNKRLSSDWKGPYEKGVLRNFPKITRKHFSWSLFIDKVRYCRSATSFKTRLSTGSFCEFCEILKKDFLRNTSGRMHLIIAASIVIKRELANKTFCCENHHLSETFTTGRSFLNFLVLLHLGNAIL